MLVIPRVLQGSTTGVPLSTYYWDHLADDKGQNLFCVALNLLRETELF